MQLIKFSSHIVATLSTENHEKLLKNSSQRDNTKQNSEVDRTLESPVFSRAFFMPAFSVIVVKNAEF